MNHKDSSCQRTKCLADPNRLNHRAIVAAEQDMAIGMNVSVWTGEYMEGPGGWDLPHHWQGTIIDKRIAADGHAEFLVSGRSGYTNIKWCREEISEFVELAWSYYRKLSINNHARVL